MGYDQDAVEVLPVLGWVRFVARRRRGLDVEAGRRVHHARRAARGGRASTRPAGSSRHARATTGIDFDIELAQEAVGREPRLLRPVRARPDRLDPAQGGRGRPRAGGRRRGAARRRAGGASSRAPWRALPEVVEDAVAAEETQGITAYATELATQFHAFYRDARVVDPAEPERSAKRLALALAAQDDARERPGAAGDLGARVDVGRRDGGSRRGDPDVSPRGRGRSRPGPACRPSSR